jgi:hypothetical protein
VATEEEEEDGEEEEEEDGEEEEEDVLPVLVTVEEAVLGDGKFTGLTAFPSPSTEFAPRVGGEASGVYDWLNDVLGSEAR